MNLAIGLLIGVIMLLVVQPVEADNVTLNDMLPLMMFGSLKVMPPLGFIPQKIESKFKQEDSPGIQGKVELTEILEQKDTQITISVSNLQPDTQYVALYYKNSDCALEEDSFDNIIQGAFIADLQGQSKVQDKAKTDINKIRSIGVHESSNFKVVSCASI